MPFAHDLLEQSWHLANRERNRPRQASLRRAVSTAYYAVFRLLTTAAAANWKTARHRTALARAFEHRRMNDACRNAKNKQFQNANQAAVRHLRDIAENFMRLQQDRHTADYDSSKRWTRKEVLTDIERAAAAFDSWKVIRKETIADDFLLQLLIQR